MEPKAWIGCLGCYNAGALVGAWVDGIEADEYEPHDALLIEGMSPWSQRPACGNVKSEERWVFDFEDFGGLLSGECSPSEATRIAEVIDRIEAESYPVEAVAAWRDYVGKDYADLDNLDDFAEAYRGEWQSEENYAETLAEDIGAVNAEATWPNNCIDWERAARDLFMDGYYSAEAPGGLIYVFDANA